MKFNEIVEVAQSAMYRGLLNAELLKDFLDLARCAGRVELSEERVQKLVGKVNQEEVA